MATTKFYLDTRNKSGDTFPLKIAINHKGSTSLLSLGVYLLESQWDKKSEKITGHSNKFFLNTFIAKRKQEVDTIILKLIETGELPKMSATAVKDMVTSELVHEDDDQEKDKGLFLPHYRKFMERKGNPHTREIYSLTLTHLTRFARDIGSLRFEDITKSWLTDFDNYLAHTSPSKNARNIHLRNIRAVFNDAIDEELTAHYPFRKFKIRGVPTAKRSLTVEELRTLFACDCDGTQRKYLDIFKLIFMLCGINVIDLCNATEISGGRLEYNRAKTGRLYSIKVEPEAMEIIGRYRGKSHLLDILDRYGNYKDYAKRLNESLKRIGHTETGKRGKKTFRPLFPQLTTYWARHSWATIAASLDIPKETIAAALGHGGNTVTDIYIDFDRKKIDEANRRVLDWVLYGKKSGVN